MKCWFLLGPLLLVPMNIAAQTPLPEAMQAKFVPGKLMGDFFYVPTGSQAKLRASLYFENVEAKVVYISYLFQAPNALPGEETKEYATSFRPTAVCKRAGLDSVFFVAGWSDRLSQTIVEKWTLSGGAVGSATPTTGGPAYSILTVPMVERELLLTSTTIGPIAAIGFNVYGGDLWLMEDEQPKETWKLHVDSTDPPQLDFSVGTTGYAFLANCNSISVAAHPNAGLVMYFEKKRKWVSGVLYHEPYDLVVKRDADRDGIFELLESMTYEQLYTMYPSGTWEVQYH